MSREIRRVQTDDEARQHAFISHYAFNQTRGEEAFEKRDRYYKRDWLLAAFDSGEMVAGLTVLPFEQFMFGARIPMGGIASVSCLPERRRQGHVSSLLRRSLEEMRDAGQWLSGLYTPHYSLYGRFGYEIASRIFSYSFPPKGPALRRRAPAGRWRRIDSSEWQTIDALYNEHQSRRNGPLVRDEHRWRTHVFNDNAKQPHDAAVWYDASGQPRGYVVYHQATRPVPTRHWPETTLRVDDWVALDAGAYTAIIEYVLGHDLVDHIVFLAGADEPIADAFVEPTHFEEPTGAWFGMMLRLVDVQRAIEARPALPQASGKGVTVAITDETAPWNAGTWRIESREGRLSAERTGTAPEASMDVRALASIYNGHIRPADAVRVGSIESDAEAAVAALADIFSVPFAPYCPDDF